jgi:hypothetical protein
MSSRELIVAGRRNDHVVMLRPKGRRRNLGERSFVFDNEDTHVNEILSRYAPPVPYVCVRKGLL